jgi:hypothetical protein
MFRSKITQYSLINTLVFLFTRNWYLRSFHLNLWCHVFLFSPIHRERSATTSRHHWLLHGARSVKDQVARTVTSPESNASGLRSLDPAPAERMERECQCITLSQVPSTSCSTLLETVMRWKRRSRSAVHVGRPSRRVEFRAEPPPSATQLGVQRST